MRYSIKINRSNTEIHDNLNAGGSDRLLASCPDHLTAVKLCNYLNEEHNIYRKTMNLPEERKDDKSSKDVSQINILHTGCGGPTYFHETNTPDYVSGLTPGD